MQPVYIAMARAKKRNDATRASGHGLEDEGEEPASRKRRRRSRKPEDDAAERDATINGVDWS